MLSPHDLARAFDRRVAAQGRGETDGNGPAFDAWLAAFWTGEGPSEPATCPDALSPLSATGLSVRWYARDGGVLGYVPGRQRGCYRVPAEAVLPVPAPRVLVLNDAPEVLAALRDVLEGEGYAVSTRLVAVDRTEVARVAPDLIVLDLMFGRETAGMRLLAELREDPATTRVPVVLCSAADDAVRRLTARHLGGRVRLVLKPLDVDKLLDEVDQALAWAAEQATVAPKPANDVPDW